MYNNEIKIKFFEEIKNNQEGKYNKNYTTLFSQLAKLEYTKNKDIYELSYEELLKEILNISVSASISTLRGKYSMLRKYKRWALINGYMPDDQKVFVEEKVDIKKIYLNGSNVILYRDSKALLDRLYTTLKFTGGDTVSMDELIIAFYSLIYQGFTPEEVTSIKLTNISQVGNNLVIKIDNKIVVLDEIFKDVIFHLYNHRSFASESPRRKGIFEMSDRLIDSGSGLDDKIMRKSLTTAVTNRKMTWMKPNEVFLMGSIRRAIQQNPWADIKTRKGKTIIANFYFQEIGNNKPTSNTVREHIYRYCEMW